MLNLGVKNILFSSLYKETSILGLLNSECYWMYISKKVVQGLAGQQRWEHNEARRGETRRKEKKHLKFIYNCKQEINEYSWEQINYLPSHTKNYWQCCIDTMSSILHFLLSNLISHLSVSEIMHFRNANWI